MRAVLTALLLSAAVAGAQPAERGWVPIGVVDNRPRDGATARSADEIEIAKRGFNVVARRDPTAASGMRVERLGTAAPGATPVPVSAAGLEFLRVADGTTPERLRREAWVAIGRGLRGVIFDDWSALRANAPALRAASDFADLITRNVALFAPLGASSREVRIDAASPDVFARFIESREAMVLVAANLSGAEQRVKMTFAPDMPEAIWQNMESGGGVNFVAGPDGPTYTRTFPPDDVVVLMIRKQYK
jgi:hypothetical protein